MRSVQNGWQIFLQALSSESKALRLSLLHLVLKNSCFFQSIPSAQSPSNPHFYNDTSLRIVHENQGLRALLLLSSIHNSHPIIKYGVNGSKKIKHSYDQPLWKCGTTGCWLLVDIESGWSQALQHNISSRWCQVSTATKMVLSLNNNQDGAKSQQKPPCPRYSQRCLQSSKWISYLTNHLANHWSAAGLQSSPAV